MSDTYARICETRNSVSKERSLDDIWYEKCMKGVMRILIVVGFYPCSTVPNVMV